MLLSRIILHNKYIVKLSLQKMLEELFDILVLIQITDRTDVISLWEKLSVLSTVILLCIQHCIVLGVEFSQHSFELLFKLKNYPIIMLFNSAIIPKRTKNVINSVLY